MVDTLDKEGNLMYGRNLSYYFNEKGEWNETHIFYDEQIEDGRYDSKLAYKLFSKKGRWDFTRYG